MDKKQAQKIAKELVDNLPTMYQDTEVQCRYMYLIEAITEALTATSVKVPEISCTEIVKAFQKGLDVDRGPDKAFYYQRGFEEGVEWAIKRMQEQ